MSGELSACEVPSFDVDLFDSTCSSSSGRLPYVLASFRAFGPESCGHVDIIIGELDLLTYCTLQLLLRLQGAESAHIASGGSQGASQPGSVAAVGCLRR